MERLVQMGHNVNSILPVTGHATVSPDNHLSGFTMPFAKPAVQYQ
jgi:hypothetical protein